MPHTGASNVSVVVPATSANLGCAFDCAGLALNLYLRARATVTGAPGIEVTYQGENADLIPHDETNLVVQSMIHAATHAGEILPGFRLEVHNDIPLGVGLGSSAAAIIAGLLLGSELCGVQLSAKALLRMALEIEGHPDNLAAAIHGGMVVSAATSHFEAPSEAVTAEVAAHGKASKDVLVAKAEVSQTLDFIAVIPDVPLPTAKARSVLPSSYSREDVVANLQRTALLTAAFFSGQRLTPELFRDRLHQPYRSPLISGIAECLEYHHPALQGIFLSGAGSAVMAIAGGSSGIEASESARAANPSANAKIIGEALVAQFRAQGTPARTLHLKADNQGTQLINPQGPRTLQ